MQGSPYYHDLTGKYITAFGALFTDIKIQRYNKDKEVVQTVKVPVTYGPREKYSEINITDPDKNRKYKTQVPIIGYELTGFTYDKDRQLIHTHVRSNYGDRHEDGYRRALEPVPYNLHFNLRIIAAGGEDAFKIIEQIIPNFRAEYNLTIYPMENLPDMYIDTPVIMDSHKEYYDNWNQGDIKDQRRVEWVLQFTMKALYWGPVKRGKVIKIITANFYTGDEKNNPPPATVMTIQPGLTADGEPTTDINETIPYQQIDAGDDYGYIVTIEDQ